MVYYNPRYDLIGVTYYDGSLLTLLEINEDGCGVKILTSEWVVVGVL